jgi:putative tricarboxylic transport membrane protein
MNFRDALSSFFWLIVSIYLCVESLTLGFGAFKNPGPGFVLFWAGAFLGVFSIAQLVNSILKGRGEEGTSSLWKSLDWGKVVLVTALLFMYVILLSRLGYLITTFGFLALVSGVMNRQKMLIPVVAAFIASFLSYLIFCVWLEVQLPKGWFGF